MSEQDPRPSIYSPLNVAKKEIRVLVVEPSTDDHRRIICRLEVISLTNDHHPAYEAVSWCWGETSHKKEILLNGEPFAIQENAVEVLEQVCIAKGHHRVWLDAVCINQEDIDERSQQVAMMDKVYSLATKVPVWLGLDDTGDIERAFASLELLKAHFLEHSRQYMPNRNKIFLQESRAGPSFSAESLPNCDWPALDHFFSVGWFSRLWVCQEVTLSYNVVCLRGSCELPWETIGLAAQWLLHRHYERTEYMGKGLKAITAAAKLWEYQFLRQPDWENLLWLSGDRRAKNPVDHVYGLLGMMPRVLASRVLAAEQELKPDYTKDLALVFAAATRVAIKMRQGYTNALNVLWMSRIYVPPDPSSDVRCEPDDDDWPSWVPRFHWTVDPHRGSQTPMHDWHGDNAVGTYRAVQMAPYNDSPLVLGIKGVIVAQVETTGFKLSEDFIWGDDKRLFESIASTRKWAIDSGIPERDFAMTLTSRKTSLESDAALDENFYSQYQAFIACCCENQDWTPAVREYRPALFRGSANRRFFTTSSKIGKYGVGHPNIKPGDYVCILFCGMSPFVLRRKREHWRLIGSAYVHDIMHGEYIDQWRKKAGHERDIVDFDIH